MNPLLALLAAAAILEIVLLALILRRKMSIDLTPIDRRLDSFEKAQERAERTLREEVAKGREESANQARLLREEVGRSIKALNDSVLRVIGEMTTVQKLQLETFGTQLGRLTESHETKAEALRTAVEAKLESVREDNAKQLEQMRQTVDEKLQGALEQRLGESFKLVSERLELVHRGLGEMQSLASGVGDLKRVLTNVKVRGTWGEVQLAALLEQILTRDQYAINVATKPESSERVEFAIRLPGRGDRDGDEVWLPIDSKFPQEDYLALMEAQERGDLPLVEAAGRRLEVRIRACGKDICDKYLNPPATTDFGIMFLPTEGLYAEVIRRTGLVETMQRDCRVVIAGPTTLAALLNSLQMGFRTLAIEKRSSEVWSVLSGVKAEFGKFGEVLDRVKKKLHEASKAVDSVETRTRAMGRKLKGVEELAVPEAERLLLGGADDGVVPGTPLVELAAVADS